MKEFFRRFSTRATTVTGSSWAFVIAIGVVIIWALSGPLFGFSDTWQLVINTGTGLVTFLMVFLIQNSQNRDTKAMQLKLDELINSNKQARNTFLNIEDRPEDELIKLKQELVESQIA